MSSKSPNLKFRIQVNGKEVENTFATFKKEYFKAKAILDKSPIGSDAWKEAAKNLSAYKKLMDDAKKEQKELVDQMRSDEEVVNDFSDSVGQIFTGLKTGNFKEIKAGLNGVATGIRGVGKAALSLIANPIGATIAVLAGIGLAVKEWANYNEVIWESQRLTEQITGLVGEQAHQVRIHGQTLSEVFDQDYKKVLETGNTLVKNFKEGWTETLQEIEDGLIEGQVANDEYLESLNEYAPFMAKAGYSLREFKNIISTGYDLGVFKDKLPDALKEFHLSMTEQTKASQEALDNAFGIKFTDKLFKGIKDGSITTKKALQLITKESKKYGLSVQQQQQLTADLFRGAGEDAGGALKIFEAINTSLEVQTTILTPLQEVMKETTEVHHELAAAKDEALRSDDYIAFAGEMDIIWTKIKTVFYQALGGIRNVFMNTGQFLTKQIALTIITLRAFPKAVQENFLQIVTSIKGLIKSTLSFGNVFDRILHLDVEGAKEAAKEYAKNVNGSFNEVKESASGVVDEISRIRKEAAKKIDLHFEERKQALVDLAKIEEQKNAEEEVQKHREHMTRKQLEELRKRLQKEKEYRDLIILGSQDLIVQEQAAHDERLKKAGLFGKKKNQLSSEQIRALELLELQHKTNLVKIENDAIQKHIAKQKEQFDKEQRTRQIAHNNEIADLQSVEDAKALLKDTLSEEELKEITTLTDAKAALNRQFEDKELEHQATFLQKQMELLNSVLNGDDDTGINLADKLLTDEQKELLKERIEEVKLKLSEIGVKQAEEEEEEEEPKGADIDIFGFSAEDWANTFNNLDTANDKIAAAETIIGGLMNTWGMYHQFLAANEKKSLANFEKNTNKRKAALKKQLDQGIISKEEYNKQTEKLDKDLAKKKAEIEYKQAKREKSLALVGAIVNTAMAIVKAFSDLGPIGGAIAAVAIGIMGGMQIATISKQPLPDRNAYADGGFTKGMGYYDETGQEVAGTVHADEYVIPKFVMDSTDPAIPQIVDYLETKRQMKLGKFAEGGFTSTPSPVFTSGTETTTENDQSTNDPMLLFATAANRLLDEGIMAYSFIGDDQILEFEERLAKLKQSRNNAKRQ